MIEFESTREGKPPTSETSVVYDARDGTIVYVHEFIGDGKGVYGAEGQTERGRVALERARHHLGSAAQLEVLHLPRDFHFARDTLYRVDLAAGRLAVRGEPSGAARSAGKSARGIRNA
jgi:hypothetical protein